VFEGSVVHRRVDADNDIGLVCLEAFLDVFPAHQPEMEVGTDLIELCVRQMVEDLPLDRHGRHALVGIDERPVGSDPAVGDNVG